MENAYLLKIIAVACIYAYGLILPIDKPMSYRASLSNSWENIHNWVMIMKTVKVPSKILPYMVSALLKLKYIIGINEDLTDVLDSLITL